MRSAVIILIGLLFVGFIPAVLGQEDPQVLLDEARARHVDHVAAGLESFEARIVLRRTENEGLNNYKELANFGYGWTAPEAEVFDFEKTHELLHKPLKDALGRMWRDLTGALWFDVLSKTENLRMESGDAFDLVAGEIAEYGTLVASFETGSKALFEFEFLKWKLKETYTWETSEPGLQVASREVWVGGAPKLRLTYRVFRKVSGFLLPTVLRLKSDQGDTEYGVEYLTVNGEKAEVAQLTDDEVAELVKAFEKVWRDLDDFEKVARLPEYSETRNDLISASIAKVALRDRSSDVRSMAAETLGVMKRRNVVPALLSALKKNKDEPDVYLKVIRSLGEIGDPRAVPALSKGWWSERNQERAIAMARSKIRALGNIRHHDSVDALIESLYAAKDETIGRIAADLLMALTKLTGENFGPDRKAWKDWWKRNRSSYRF